MKLDLLYSKTRAIISYCLRNIHYILCFLLAASSIYLYRGTLLYFFLGTVSDMAFLLERYFNPNFITNDFFTNASSESNPRWIYAYLVIGLTKLFSSDWHTTLCAIKVFLILAVPVIWYGVLFNILLKYSNGNRLVIGSLSFVCVFLAIFPEISHPFSIACFYNFEIQPISSNIALYTGLFAYLISFLEKKYTTYLVCILFFLSTFVNPSMGLCVYAFFAILNFKKVFSWQVILSGLMCVLAGVSIMLIFQVENTLSAKELYEYYANLAGHRVHYIPSYFLKKNSNFFIITGFLFCFAIIYKARKENDLFILSILFALALSASVGLQYLFVELIHTRVFILLGITRFTSFTYWMFVILLATFISKSLPTERLINRFEFFQFLFSQGQNKLKLSYMLLVCIVLSYIYISSQTNISYPIQEKDLPLKEWISTTPTNSIFAAPTQHLSKDIALGMKRAIFANSYFPFREDALKEHVQRRKLLRGEWVTAHSIGFNRINYYRSLTPHDFVRISKIYPLDYVLIESKYDSSFQKYEADFEYEDIKVYAVKKIR